MNRIASWLAGITLCMLGGTSLAADLPAVVGWLQRVELGTLVSGVVSEVHVRPGQQVRRGDKLLSLDSRGFASQVSRRTAEHQYAQAALKEAQREDERAIELYDRTVLSDFERNQALVALKAARAVAERARAALAGTKLAHGDFAVLLRRYSALKSQPTWLQPGCQTVEVTPVSRQGVLAQTVLEPESICEMVDNRYIIICTPPYQRHPSVSTPHKLVQVNFAR